MSLSIKKAIEKSQEQTSTYSKRPSRPGKPNSYSKDFRSKRNFKPKESFDDKMANFSKG